ncbi:hypothetical protein KC644_01050 [Candidatus Berkelbacteria bacterium]|nr:hypothetical protein [Candidatus Berkelbacteria bacterium]
MDQEETLSPDSQIKESIGRTKRRVLTLLGIILAMGGVVYLSSGFGSRSLVETDQGSDNETMLEGYGFDDVGCGDQRFKLSKIASSEVAIVVSGKTVSTGSQITALVHCYLNKYSEINVIYGYVGVEAYLATQKQRHIGGNNDLSDSERLLLRNNVFSVKRNAGSYTVSLPTSGIYSE